ncbi:MAG: hypothetical protein JWP09_548 [Candidatus Taylorbacteria bacterium]|nr:hypothetical protein [Candidatus Taylorbacteria bacterium]
MNSDPGLFQLELALRAASASEGSTTPQLPPPQTRQWKGKGSEITWEHELFGKLQLNILADLGEVQSKDGFTIAPLNMETEKVNRLQHHIKTNISFKLAAKTHLLYFKNNRMMDVSKSSIPQFVVPMNWKAGAGGRIEYAEVCKPQASKRDDNDDEIILVFLREDGLFIELEVGVVVRGGKFLFVTIQEVSTAQIVRTTREKIEQHGLKSNAYRTGAGGKYAIIVPAKSEDAYPGFNWLKAREKIGESLMPYALARDYSAPLSQCIVAEWDKTQPPALPAHMAKWGFELAQVFWFNVMYGGGFVRLMNGEMVHVHFNSIVDGDIHKLYLRGFCPVIKPMTWVAVNHAPNPQRGNRDCAKLTLQL